MEETFNPDKMIIRVLNIELNPDRAREMGIENVRNTTTHKEWFDKNPFPKWNNELIKHPDNLLLNRLDGNVVISSLIEFADEFSYNLFILKKIYIDMEGGMSSLRKSFLN